LGSHIPLRVFNTNGRESIQGFFHYSDLFRIFKGVWKTFASSAKKTAWEYFAPPELPAEHKNKGVTNMEKMVCSVCGYVYDPAVGDPDNGIAPGTKFEDLPEDYVCPICGVGKDMFEPAE